MAQLRACGSQRSVRPARRLRVHRRSIAREHRGAAPVHFEAEAARRACMFEIEADLHTVSRRQETGGDSAIPNAGEGDANWWLRPARCTAPAGFG